MLTWIQNYFQTIGNNYHVNPLIFGSVYVGAIPFFSLSIAWLIHRYKTGRSIVLPTLAAGSCFVSAYVYLLIVGQNVPWWVYAILVAMVIYGAYSTVKKVKKKINEPLRGIKI